jgi:hypothetical protein
MSRNVNSGNITEMMGVHEFIQECRECMPARVEIGGCPEVPPEIKQK